MPFVLIALASEHHQSIHWHFHCKPPWRTHLQELEGVYISNYHIQLVSMHWTFCPSLPDRYHEFRSLLGNAIRWGEAQNPGPPGFQKLGILNPTAVKNKAKLLVDFMVEHQLNQLCLSETAAILDTQKRVAATMRVSGVKTLWSTPVPTQHDENEQRCERGKPGGVAVLSTTRIRHQIMQPGDTMPSHRTIHTISWLGQLQYQLIVCYGFPQNFAQAKQLTDEILQDVHSKVAALPLPFMVVGDFNTDVTLLPSWSKWESLGCKDLKMIHQHLYHMDMPPTCLGKTWPDNAIVCPVMQQFVQSINVLPCEDFPTHSPVVLTLQTQQQQPTRPKLAMPKTFLDFDVPKEIFVRMAEEHTPQQTLTLEQWGAHVEEVYSLAMQDPCTREQGHHQPDQLPRAYRGRCQPSEPINMPYPCTAKSSRQGEYQPDQEITQFGARKKLKQYRRLQSLYQQIVAHQADDEMKWYRSQNALHTEWKTILRSRAFGIPFSVWLANHPDIGYPPWPLPHQDWLHHTLQIVKFDLDAHLAADALLNKQMKHYMRDRSQKNGSKAHFAYVRHNPNRSLQELAVPVQRQCDVSWEPAHQKAIVVIDSSDVVWGTPVYLNEKKGWIVGADPQHIQVQFPIGDEPDYTQNSVLLRQTCQFSDPQEIARELSQFWEPLWNSTDVPTEQQIQQFEELISELPINIPEMHIDHGIEQWKSAIRRLKGNTAKGFDRITAWELKALPDSLIMLLSDTLLSYPSYPVWFMRARTHPISKVEDTPQASQIRPITVLPLLYRVYASLVCRQILQIWNRIFPRSITGLLPGRGSHGAAYEGQYQLEQSSRLGNHLSGITLDLEKCFNIIWHYVGPRLLSALGVPQEYITRWHQSLGNITRYWELHACTIGPIPTSRGLPEGDTHSVLIMLAISLLWILEIGKRDAQTSPTAYADNWGWTSEQAESHTQAAQATMLVTQLCGLRVDWNKTWLFATSTAEAKRAKVALSVAFPEHEVDRLHHARDLGFELRYSGSDHLGHRVDRYQNALQRLKKLSRLEAEATEKEKLWLVSIFPQAFYGSEICPPSGDLVKKFRSKAAHSIFGKSTSMSPAIALLLGIKHVLDPGYLLIWKAITAARTWLFKATQHQRDTFFQLVAQFRGGIAKVRGPASDYMAEIDWTMDSHGNLLIGPFTKFHILNTSQQVLKKQLTLAWQTDLPIRYTERKHLYNMMPISRIDTIRVLNTFTPKERGHLAREIAGAFQTQHQQAQWQQDNTEACIFCSQPDSRHHRLFECPNFAQAREIFAPTLEWWEHNSECIADLPVLYVRPDEQAHQVMQHAEATPVIGRAFFDLARQRRDADTPLHVYTDGSCAFPEHPSTRFAGFAAVIDLCQTDAERIHAVDMYFETGSPPNTFQIMCQSRVQGEQNIGRAEFAALEVTTRLPGNIVTHTDSQSSLQIIDKIRNGTFDFLKGNNLDIAEKISMQLHKGHQFRKVKAHQALLPTQDPLEVYHALGNNFVDHAAKELCKTTWSSLTHALHQRQVEQQESRDHLQQLYRCILALQEARIKSEQVVDMCHSEEMLDALRNVTSNLSILCDYTPVNGYTFHFPELGTQLFSCFPWGESMAKQFQHWFDLLVYPGDDHRKPCCRAGVSWLELGLSFTMFIKALPPIIRVDSSGTKQLVWVSTQDDMHKHHVTLADIASTMQLIWGHFVSYISPSHDFNPKRGLNKSLMWIGFQQHTCRLMQRPMFYLQRDVVIFLQNNLAGLSNFDHLREFPWVSNVREDALRQQSWLTLRDLSYRTRRTFWRLRGH